MKTNLEIYSEHFLRLNPDGSPYRTDEDIENLMEEYAKQQAIEFVRWANGSGWYKHYDAHDDCWTNRDGDISRTATTENLYDMFRS